jgi:hypothetical protein
MAIQYHPDIQVIAGATWTIAGTLYDGQANVLDITNCTLAWCLIDPDGNPVPTVNVNYTINKSDPSNGGLQVLIARDYTALNPGRYTDALQVVAGMNKDVFWIGQILVAASPFA